MVEEGLGEWGGVQVREKGLEILIEMGIVILTRGSGCGEIEIVESLELEKFWAEEGKKMAEYRVKVTLTWGTHWLVGKQYLVKSDMVKRGHQLAMGMVGVSKK